MEIQQHLAASEPENYSSPSEVFAYASKLVENDLAAAVRIFRQSPKRPNAEKFNAEQTISA